MEAAGGRDPERVSAGEGDLAEIYRHYGRTSYSLARHICDDDGLAEDVVEDVFLAVWHDLCRYGPDPGRAAFATWLLSRIHHQAVDAVRRETVMRRRTGPAVEAGAGWSSVLHGADQVALVRAAAGQVLGALDRLTDDQRQVVVLAYYGGRSQGEIAELVGVPVATVKSRMFAGVQRLRSLLEPEDVLADLRNRQERPW